MLFWVFPHPAKAILYMGASKNQIFFQRRGRGEDKFAHVISIGGNRYFSGSRVTNE
jgi:hypothetical protein